MPRCLKTAFGCLAKSSEKAWKKPLKHRFKGFLSDFGATASFAVLASGAENETLTYVFLMRCSSSTSLWLAGLFSQSGTPAGTFLETHSLCEFYPPGNCFSRFTDTNIVLFFVMRYQVLQTFIGALYDALSEQLFYLADLVVIFPAKARISDLAVRS